MEGLLHLADIYGPEAGTETTAPNPSLPEAATQEAHYKLRGGSDSKSTMTTIIGLIVLLFLIGKYL